MCGALRLKARDPNIQDTWCAAHVELRENSLTCFSGIDKLNVIEAHAIDADTSVFLSPPVPNIDEAAVFTVTGGVDTHLTLAADTEDKRRKWTETLEACCLKARLKARKVSSLSTPTPYLLATPATAKAHLFHDVARLHQTIGGGGRSGDGGGLFHDEAFFTPPPVTPVETQMLGDAGRRGSQVKGVDVNTHAQERKASFGEQGLPLSHTHTPATNGQEGGGVEARRREEEGGNGGWWSGQESGGGGWRIRVEEREKELWAWERKVHAMEEQKLMLEKERVRVYKEREKDVEEKRRAVDARARSVEELVRERQATLEASDTALLHRVQALEVRTPDHPHKLSHTGALTYSLSYTHIRTHKHTHAHTHIQTLTHTHTQTQAHAHSHTRAHTHTHTHKHSHTPKIRLVTPK